MNFDIKGNLVDIHRRKTYPAKVTIKNGRIDSIEEIDEKLSNYLVPPFVDACINLERTYLKPQEYAKVGLIHGVVGGVVNTPKIFRDFGRLGVLWLMDNVKETSFRFSWSVNPYLSDFYSKKDILSFLEIPSVSSLGHIDNLEFSNDVIYVMVFAQSVDKVITASVKNISSKEFGRLSAKNIKVVFDCANDESVRLALKSDLMVGFDRVSSFVDSNSTKSMFCSSGSSVEDLVCEYIDDWVRECLGREYDIYRVFQVSTVNPIKLFKLDVGLLREGDWADFLVVDNLKDFNIEDTYVKGRVVASNGMYLEKEKRVKIPSNIYSDRGLVVSSGEYSTFLKLPILGYLSDLGYMDLVEEYSRYIKAKRLAKRKKK